MIEVRERPLLTFVLLAYNQEKYIREAVEGALAQTYQPLEIILSDDASSDATYEIISSMTASYRGSHYVKIRRNASNLGLARHLEAVAATARGRFLVLGAGDDISNPDRVAEIAALANQQPETACIYSAYTKIDEAGNVIGDMSCTCEPTSRHQRLVLIMNRGSTEIRGATTAYRRDVLTRFNPLPKDLFQEDQVLPVRALLIGNIAHISRPLVRYRLTSNSIWRSLAQNPHLSWKENQKRSLAKLNQAKLIFLTWKKDVELAVATGMLSESEGNTYLRIITQTEQVVVKRFLAICGPYHLRVWSALRLFVPGTESPTPSLRYRLFRLALALAPNLAPPLKNTMSRLTKRHLPHEPSPASQISGQVKS